MSAGRILAPTLLCLLLGGCSAWQQAEALRDEAAATQARVAREREAFGQRLAGAEARRAAQDVARPWLAGRPQPLAREVTLPPALRADVDTTLMFPGGRIDLSVLGERIALATGIPVRVQPEALLPVAAFMPRLGGELSQPAVSASHEALVDIPAGARPLPGLLDLVAARLGVAWRFQDGVLTFYRTETQVFNVRALVLKSSSQASLGRSGGAGQGDFKSTSHTQIESSVDDVMAAIRTRLEPLLTRAGVVTAGADGTGLVVVTDTPEALARVAAYLARENRTLTRRVRLVFEEVSVAVNEGNDAGIDWNLVYAAARVGAGFEMPATLASPVAGALSVSATDGRWTGSAAVVRALSQAGTVMRHSSVPLLTLNRRPVTHAVRTSFTYINQVQTTSVANESGSGALPSVAISQKEETVGQFLTVIPDAQDDGQILLSVAYDTTVAQPLQTVTFGRGDNAVQIQQLTVDGNGTVQQVELRPGQPVVISGFERTTGQHDRRRLDARAPLLLGGAERSSRNHITTVLIVTAQVEEGY